MSERKHPRFRLLVGLALALGSMGGSLSAQTTIYVDDDNCPGPGSGSLGDPFCSIQDAIDIAIPGDEVLVAQGTYNEVLDLLGKSITVRSSDGADVTVIDGSSISASVILCTSGEGPATVVDGFTVTGGSGTVDTGVPGEGLPSGHTRGGGVFNNSDDGTGSLATLNNCVLWGNVSDAIPLETAQVVVGRGSVSNSTIEGLHELAGNGNRPFAPHLLDPPAGDAHLQTWSSMINAGDPDYVPDPGETDFDGDPRVLLERVDIGADESPISSPDVDLDGLPDDWELQYWPGDLSQTGSGDPDGDCLPNSTEYLFGYDPTVANIAETIIWPLSWEPNVLDVIAGESTQIGYTLYQGGNVTVEVFDTADDVIVRRLSEQQLPGDNVITWDGHGERGNPDGSDLPALSEGYTTSRFTCWMPAEIQASG